MKKGNLRCVFPELIYKPSFILLILLSIMGAQATAQIIATDLLDLRRYLDDNNVDVKLAPGTYWITVEDIHNGLYATETLDIYGRDSRALLMFKGNNSTYDFSDVTINIETAVFDAIGSGAQTYEVHTTGNNNVLKNLTLVDVGSVDDEPRGGANSIVMDGRNNRVEGFHVTIKGSYPYGYGDAFGKGGSWTIKHYKHSACLVRGESNHVLNSTFIHRSYGHCIYMQAASNPIIEGCYVEGEMRSTDDMLAEEGTGSPADNIDFMTDWGYRLPPGFMMSTGEAGIRAYNAGETIIDGEKFEGIGTSNPTVINCTIKNMRTGVTLAHASGTKYVSGCTAIGCENGFSLGAGEVIDCKADVAFGPAYSSTYQNDRNYDADITIIEAENGFYYNGAKSVAYMGGSSHKLELKGTGANIPTDYTIKMGGNKGIVRLYGDNSPNQNNLTASNNEIINTTGASITLVSGSNNNTIETCGTVSDNALDNDITTTNDCEEVDNCEITTAHIEAECYSSMFGIQTQESSEGTDNVGWINNGDWVSYGAIDLTGMESIKLRVATNTGGTIEIRIGSTTGTVISSIEIPNTGGFQAWETVGASIESTQGEQEVYLVFSGATNYLFNLNYFGFSESVTLSIDEHNLDLNQITLYPNPVITSVKVENAKKSLLSIFNVLGVVVYSEIISSESEIIDLSGLTSGVYYTEIKSATKVVVGKIVKQ